ncbi:MAG: 2-oxo acid dehydrogenase subunit E2 [Myxococcales bacterium]|nr:2-oxo acid dehydrogenase subunit E2 [Myxococcales bacterium]
MSRYEFKLPDIGEGVTEGEIVEWHVKVGDRVTEDQPLVEVMTDKATVTITSPKTGTIADLRGGKGQVVKVHSVLVVFDLGGGTAAVASTPAAAAKSEGPAATAVGDIKDVLPGMGAFTATAKPGAPAPTTGGAWAMAGSGTIGLNAAIPGRDTSGKIDASNLSLEALRQGVVPPATQKDEDEDYSAPDGKALATPATRKLARDLGVDLAKVKPSGPGNRVTKEDVRAYVAKQQAKKSAPASAAGSSGSAFAAVPAAPGAQPESSAPPAKSEGDAKSEGVFDQLGKREEVFKERAPVAIAPVVSGKGEALEERVPFRGVRRKIAEKMHQSKTTAAHFTFVEEVDCTALKELRERLKPKAEKLGAKLTYLPFIAKAVVAALKKHPILNSALDESTNELVYRKYYNLGIATATETGLIVPVVKNADKLSLVAFSKEMDRVATAARSGKASLDDLQGSTFTITSLGAQGGLFATPIINFPEVAILGVHQMKQKPVVRDGQIVIGDVMLLSLSFDHRIIDGHVGAAFAYEVINYLQDPDRLVLDL